MWRRVRRCDLGIDIHYAVSAGHRKLVDIRLGYDSMFAGEGNYEDLLANILDLEAIAKDLRKVIPRRYRAREKQKAERRARIEAMYERTRHYKVRIVKK